MIEINISGEATTVAEDVKKCLNVLLSTRVGELAMDRDFGLSWDWLDMPAELAKANMSAEILEKVAKYEPRARINLISFTGASDGKLAPKLEVSINV